MWPVVVAGAVDVAAEADEALAEAQRDAEALEVGLHGLPQAGRERAVEDVEDDALGVTDEVEVEHHHQLGGRELLLRVEERVGEDIEEHLARARREAEAVEELARAHMIVLGVGGLGVVGHHGPAEGVVDAQGVA